MSNNSPSFNFVQFGSVLWNIAQNKSVSFGWFGQLLWNSIHQLPVKIIVIPIWFCCTTKLNQSYGNAKTCTSVGKLQVRPSSCKECSLFVSAEKNHVTTLEGSAWPHTTDAKQKEIHIWMQMQSTINNLLHWHNTTNFCSICLLNVSLF